MAKDAIMLFEPKVAAINAKGYASTDSAVPPRHPAGNNVALMDGSAQIADTKKRKPASDRDR